MTTIRSEFPFLVEKVFAKIITDQEESNPALKESHFLELYSLFGEVLETALYIIDTKKITSYQSPDGFKEIIEIAGYQSYYKLFPDINYCTCPAFEERVLTNRSQYTCSHVLAVKLARILKTVEIEKLTAEQFDFIAKQVN